MMGDWTLFSNHGHVLVCLARQNDARLRDVAVQVGITERAVQKIVKDLQEAGFVEVRKQGRCNRYRINRRKSLRHALESQCTVGKLLNLVAPPGPAGRLVVEPDVALKPELEPEPVSEPEPVPEPESEKSVKSGKKETKECESPAGPVDVRQQGRLF